MKGKRILLLLAAVAALVLVAGGVALAQAPPGLPPFPAIFQGQVTIGGQAAPDGTIVSAKVGGVAASGLAVVLGGNYYLSVGVADSSYVGKTVEFYTADTKAEQTATYAADKLTTLNLSFPEPVAPSLGGSATVFLWLALLFGGALLLGGAVLAWRLARR